MVDYFRIEFANLNTDGRLDEFFNRATNNQLVPVTPEGNSNNKRPALPSFEASDRLREANKQKEKRGKKVITQQVTSPGNAW